MVGKKLDQAKALLWLQPTNGKCGRASRTITTILQKLVNGKREAWVYVLGPALTAIWNNASTVSGFILFMLDHAGPVHYTIKWNIEPHL